MDSDVIADNLRGSRVVSSQFFSGRTLLTRSHHFSSARDKKHDISWWGEMGEEKEKNDIALSSFVRVIYKNRIHGAQRDTRRHRSSNGRREEERGGEGRELKGGSRRLRIKIKLVSFAERRDAIFFIIFVIRLRVISLLADVYSTRTNHDACSSGMGGAFLSKRRIISDFVEARTM